MNKEQIAIKTAEELRESFEQLEDEFDIDAGVLDGIAKAAALRALDYQEARVQELEAENERLRDALLDIKNGKDNPCYLADKAMRGEEV